MFHPPALLKLPCKSVKFVSISEYDFAYISATITCTYCIILLQDTGTHRMCDSKDSFRVRLDMFLSRMSRRNVKIREQMPPTPRRTHRKAGDALIDLVDFCVRKLRQGRGDQGAVVDAVWKRCCETHHHLARR